MILMGFAPFNNPGIDNIPASCTCRKLLRLQRSQVDTNLVYLYSVVYIKAYQDLGAYTTPGIKGWFHRSPFRARSDHKDIHIV
jgi:hypothetical protein